MPDKDGHLAVAGRNQELIDRLLPVIDHYPDWVAVIAFYKALHIVDAVLFVDNYREHGGSHDNRDRILKTTNRYQNLYRHYRPLFAASLVGRYLECGGREYRLFTEYLSPQKVKDIILGHHLRQLEVSAEKIIGPLKPPPAD